LILVQREIDRGFARMDEVFSKSSPAFAQAVKAYSTAMIILPRISGLNPADRTRLEAKLQELRSRLDQVPAFANVQTFRASFAS